jgi:isopropylmalate/homocitrate/citramalate synthase
MVDRTYYYLDKINRLKDVLSELNLPPSIMINDVTLREADQIVSFSMKEKIEIAHALDDLGVSQIQVGIPGVSETDKKTVQSLINDKLKSKIEVVSFIYLPDWKRDVDACLETGAYSINMFFPVSDDKLKAKGVSRQKAIDISINAIEYAKAQGVPHVTYCPFPAVRMEASVLKEIIDVSGQAGADMILLTDTYGTASPTAMRHFVREIKRVSKVPMGIHCHNDLGLALANTLAAVEGGAELVDASVNGLGDRTGNCCLDEVIIGLTAFYDFDLGVKTDQLYALAKRVEKISRIPMPFGKPLVGENCFVHRHDDDVKSSIEDPSSTVPIEPRLVGNKKQFILSGEYTGPITVKAKAKELGFDLSDEAAKEVLTSVRKNLQGKKTPLTDEEFLFLIKKSKAGK